MLLLQRLFNTPMQPYLATEGLTVCVKDWVYWSSKKLDLIGHAMCAIRGLRTDMKLDLLNTGSTCGVNL